MADEKRPHHHDPLHHKVHFPWKHNRDDGSGTPSDKKLHLIPWRHHRDDGSGTVSEKQPLLSASSDNVRAAAAAPKKKKKKKETATTSPLVSQRTWDVKMPPSHMKMVNGVPVPTDVIGGTFGSLLHRKRRRFSIEVHSEDASSEPPASLLRGDSFTEAESGTTEHAALRAGDIVEVRILKPASKIDARDLGLDAADKGEVWITHYVLGLDNVKIIKMRGAHVEMRLGDGDETQRRSVYFANDKDATSFQQVLSKLYEMENKLKEERLKKFRELDSTMAKRDLKQIRLLVEIVSAINLPEVRGVPPNPYVIVSLGDSKECHRTGPIHGNDNPIWTVATGSLFLLDVSPEDFFGSAQGLTFFVKDYDAVSVDDSLGKMFVSQETLLKSTGARIEYDLDKGVVHRKIGVQHGLNLLQQDGQGIVSKAETEFEACMMGGMMGERIHPVNDVRKVVRGDDSDSDDDSESGLDKALLRPVNDLKRLVRGESEGNEDDAFKWCSTQQGKLVLRVRNASDEDVAFMHRLASSQKEGVFGIYADETFVSTFAF